MKGLFFIILTVIFTGQIFADARSDFEYQYGKYRSNYSEYTLYKNDYLSNPTLDNQQKALIAAKQSINTRELTRASFAAFLRDLILSNRLVGYQMDNEMNTKLIEAQQFFSSQSHKSLGLVTLADISDFNESYANEYPKYEKILKAGIVAQKLSKLKYFALKQDESLAALREKIPSNVSVRVFERLDNLQNDLLNIHSKIDNLRDFLLTEESLDNTESEVFFSSRVELLGEIRQLQLSWMDKLIDLDLNYGKI